MDFFVNNYKLIWAVFSTLGMGIIFWLSKTYAKREDVTALNMRITAVEKEVKNLPNKDQLHRLQLEISELRGDIRKLEPQLDSVGRLSDLLLENKLGEK